MVTERCAGQWNSRGLPRGSGESRAKRSATGPAGPWTLLAREAEGPLRQPAGQLSGPTSCNVSLPRCCTVPPTRPTTLSGAPHSVPKRRFQ
mgnify:CR=1 FL=1